MAYQPVAKVVQERKMGTAKFAPRHDPRNKALSLKRIGWLYPIFFAAEAGVGTGSPSGKTFKV